MKKYLSFIAFAMMAVFSLAFVSCGDDDDDEPSNSNSDFVGTWEVKWWEGTEYDSFEYYKLKSDGTYIFVQEVTEEDKQDEDYTEKEKAQGYAVYHGVWSASNNKLFLKVPEESEFKGLNITFDIVKKEKDNMTLSVLGIPCYFIRVSDKTIEKYL